MLDVFRSIIAKYPGVTSLLNGKAYYYAKTYDYFLQVVANLIQSVYEGALGGEFVNIMRNLVLGQISQAYEQAWRDDGNDTIPPEYLRDASQAAVLAQYEFIEPFYRNIVDARVDQTPIEPLLTRAPLWANRYTEAYNTARALIAEKTGGKLQWKLGRTEKHCVTCFGLNGLVAYAYEWSELDVKPQNAPNPILECEGWRCDCELTPTDRRRSPKVYDTILNVVSK